jgi:hypothetical protein
MDLPEEFMFTFAAAGDAIGAEKKLLAGGLAPAVMPLPDQIGAGCGLCLRVAPDDLERARSLLGAGFQKIYAVSPAEHPDQAGPGKAGAGKTGPGKKVFSLWNP